MKKLLTVIAVALCACPAAAGGPKFGVADDAGKYSDDGGAAVYTTLRDIGMTENRMVVLWDAARPLDIVEKPFLDRALPIAEEHGIRLVFAVAPRRARSLTASREGGTQKHDGKDYPVRRRATLWVFVQDRPLSK